MKLGMIGLGKMGYNLVLNLLSHEHEVVVNDSDHKQVDKIAEEGGIPAYSIREVVEKLDAPRSIWLMVPAGEVTERVIDELAEMMSPGDTIIDGGNSNYKDTLRIADVLKEKNIHLMDAGTSGGVDGARYGACFMVGGPEEAISRHEKVFQDVAVENGYLHAGDVGSGHYLKMIHNGIEYGMMQAIAEGFDVLEKSPFDYDYEKVAKVWNHGSVIRSWLMELTENAFSKDPKLDEIAGIVNSSGEGKWTVETALEQQVAAPVIALSLMMRYRSLEQDTFTGKLLAALRNEFGGHAVVKAEK
ncbi:phosphogluconate dehydrogenase (NAD(+)-dependent, decarboxylating) [Salipaludibacillus aurantiacus]|uniref:6-phosphogluconate dehydrogenase n=1 Tax=Salipaludibacillus aurantiacus TaxID=1601833 RepID=A0A1H9UAU2_9BACI|nr:decarboxylating 6-phosphogluconate dehydrogenase [Salipaludibacillus aurantiacus]SES06566.1 6-phosphogluconate dehydrogenase [Salipaludibacillus aurantiacus]